MIDYKRIQQLTRCRSTVAREIADVWDMVPSMSMEELQAAGLTHRQAQSLVAALSLMPLRGGSRVADPLGAERVVRAHMSSDGWAQEVFFCLHLNARQAILRYQEVARGSVSHVEVHPREVYRRAVVLGAHSIVVGHTHPSGDPAPSDADVKLTNRLAEAGGVVGIPLLDHVIVTRSGYQSLAALGMVPRP